ncbi:MAG: hypothetical protein ACNA8P_06585, partial [Phycisphaerales bacterium]
MPCIVEDGATADNGSRCVWSADERRGIAGSHDRLAIDEDTRSRTGNTVLVVYETSDIGEDLPEIVDGNGVADGVVERDPVAEL